jgi:hypothetical protein
MHASLAGSNGVGDRQVTRLRWHGRRPVAEQAARLAAV